MHGGRVTISQVELPTHQNFYRNSLQEPPAKEAVPLDVCATHIRTNSPSEQLCRPIRR